MFERLQRAVGLKWVHNGVYIWQVTLHIVFWAFLLAILKHHLPFDMYTTLNNANTEIRGGRFRQTGMTSGNIIVGAVLVSSLSRELIVDILFCISFLLLKPRSLYKKREYYLESIYSKNHYNTIGQRSVLRNWPQWKEKYSKYQLLREWVMHKYQNQSEAHM